MFLSHTVLYGAETWRTPPLASPPMQKLREFFRRCVRSMNDVDMEKTRLHRIASYELQKRMGLRTIESYVSEPALRWLLGNVARMTESSLPKKLLTGWYDSDTSQSAGTKDPGSCHPPSARRSSLTPSACIWRGNTITLPSLPFLPVRLKIPLVILAISSPPRRLSPPSIAAISRPVPASPPPISHGR